MIFIFYDHILKPKISVHVLFDGHLPYYRSGESIRSPLASNDDTEKGNNKHDDGWPTRYAWQTIIACCSVLQPAVITSGNYNYFLCLVRMHKQLQLVI